LGGCYELFFDASRRVVYVSDQGSPSTSSVDVTSTATNTHLTDYTVGNGLFGGVFGSFSLGYDPVNDMLLAMSQAHGWSTFNPTTFVWSGLQGSTYGNQAGLSRSTACDTKRGHSIFVSFVNPATNPGQYEVVTVSNVTGLVSTVHAVGGQPPLAQQPAYSAAADKFIICNGTGGSSAPWYYLDPVTWALTPSAVVATVDHADNGSAMNMGIVDEKGWGVFKSGASLTIVDLVNDTIVATGIGVMGFGMQGCAYNSCKGLLYVTDGQTRYNIIDVNNAFSSVQVSATIGDMVFDPFSNLIYGLTFGSSQIQTF